MAFSPIFIAIFLFFAKNIILSAIAATSFSLTRNPVSPSSTTSTIPACNVETTGSPVAPLSKIARGVPSESFIAVFIEC